MKQRIIALLLPVIMVLSSVMYVVAKYDTTKMVFDSSEAWSEDASGDEVWSWEHSDKTTNYAYKPLDVAYENQTAFETDPNADATVDNRIDGFAWKNANAWNEAGVGKYWMIPYIKTTGTTSDERKLFSVCRKFTSLKSGKATISTKDGYIYGGSKQQGADNTTAYIRITKNGEQIWPSSGELQIPYTQAYIQKYQFAPIDVLLKENDVLRFEAYNGDGDSGYGKYVYWNPVVTYVYEPISISPSNLMGLGKDEVFYLTFNDALEEMTKENVKISGGNGKEEVKNFSHSDDKKTIGFDFDGLKGNTTYTVSVSNIVVSGTETTHSYIFTFTTGDIFEYPLCDSDLAWKETENNDSVWQWLYRNTLTMNTLTPYVPYTLTAQNYTNIYVPPIKNENDEYDYSHIGESNETSRVFCDSQSNAYMRNSLGRFWARLSVGTSTEPMQNAKNEIVKQFTAPETGKVKISAKDMDGNSKIYNRSITENNRHGAVVKILRKTQDKNIEDETLWSYSFNYAGLTPPANGVAECELEPFEINVEKGEKIWFVISGELGASAYAKQVFFRPVVEYTRVVANIVSTNPKNNQTDVAPNFTHKIEFDHKIDIPNMEDININNGANVKSISVDNGNILNITFSKLKPYTKYNVVLKNIIIQTTGEENEKIYEYSFTTGSSVEFGEIKISDGEIKTGQNVISVDINNSSGTSSLFSATLLVAVCNGNEDNYIIEKVYYSRREDIGENDMLTCNVNITDTNACFLKVLLVDDVSGAKALLPIKTFK